MTTNTKWKSNSGGLWSQGPWTGGVPGPESNVTISLTGSNTVTLDVNADINVLVMNTGGELALEGYTLQTTDGITLDAGATIQGYGTLDLGTKVAGTGGSIVASGGTLVLEMTGPVGANIDVSISGSADLQIIGSATLTDQNVSVGTGTLEVTTGSTLTLGAEESTTGGTILLDAGSILKDLDGISLGGTLIGDGTVKTGSTGELFGAGTVIASGGDLTFVGEVDQTGPATSFIIDDGAELTFENVVGTGAVDPTISFQVDGQSGSGILNLAGEAANTFDGTILNFLHGDEIIVGGTHDTFSVLGDDVEIKNGAAIEAVINFGSNAAAEAVSVSATGTITTSAICFMAGTMIRTPDGETAVEMLERGDLVLTKDGLAKPVVWLGRQTVSTVFADPLRVWPIRIKAGAIGENVPSRDLVLSPGHAVLVDGALVLAGALVNGTSIVREATVPKVFTYYHVELDDHALILAENTPAESFVDNVDRLAFDNWAEHEALYPQGRTIVELPYPVAKSHRQVPVNIRVRLAARAMEIGAPVRANVA